MIANGCAPAHDAVLHHFNLNSLDIRVCFYDWTINNLTHFIQFEPTKRLAAFDRNAFGGDRLLDYLHVETDERVEVLFRYLPLALVVEGLVESAKILFGRGCGLIFLFTPFEEG